MSYMIQNNCSGKVDQRNPFIVNVNEAGNDESVEMDIVEEEIFEVCDSSYLKTLPKRSYQSATNCFKSSL